MRDKYLCVTCDFITQADAHTWAVRMFDLLSKYGSRVYLVPHRTKDRILWQVYRSVNAHDRDETVLFEHKGVKNQTCSIYRRYKYYKKGIKVDASKTWVEVTQ